ncbi:response regulator transcription factor [Oceanospirillum linum]|uniref:response regulator transcription factor n=1 Tax=Oceanospirillum linum TaxID=966 RepID=UPI00089EAB29|nr:response regulator transcription factor [Oceanospirillum linum]SEG27920.1 DNA-binding response regulator, OmpR family, contains REC and winged-helix (wHTH) domain [Oleiphilus messinensis]SMP27306.1 two-component system, OmpR family, response regulator PfeR [Oceanospirillum linum]
MNAKFDPHIPESDKHDAGRSASLACRVLLVEDDDEVSSLVQASLQQQGYTVDLCCDGEAGLDAALSGLHQVILLDVMLPGLDGLSLLNRLRAGEKDTPVILLSALGEEQDRIRGFHSGADDYLPKPFSMQELMLRIQVLLRRCYAAASPDDNAELSDGYLQLCKKEKRAWVRNVAGESLKKLDLTPVEFELLWLLLKQKDEVLSRPYLYQLVLNRSFSRYDRSLDMHISNLRNKIRRYLPDAGLIQTVRGQGYRY